MNKILYIYIYVCVCVCTQLFSLRSFVFFIIFACQIKLFAVGKSFALSWFCVKIALNFCISLFDTLYNLFRSSLTFLYSKISFSRI